MKILHILTTIDPRSGGPIESVRQSGVEMVSNGHQVEVVCFDAPDADFLSEFPLRTHALGPANHKFAYTPRFVPWLESNASKFDAVIINGLWQYHGFGAWKVLRKMRIPYYVYPHGMLDPWFKNNYPLKHIKKWIYWQCAEHRVLRDARAVLFTAEEERILARQSFSLYQANERVVSFGTGEPPKNATELCDAFFKKYPKIQGKRIILFLGRIHAKKGCDLLVNAFARVAGGVPDAHVVIAGPDSSGWMTALKQLADDLNIGDRITWPGMLNGELKWGAFYASDVFILPSHQENFGIAVAEALGCRLPVLITDKVNIWREVKSDGAGFVGADTISGTEKMLRDWFDLDRLAQEKMREQAIETFRSRFTAHAMARDLVGVLKAA
ncbi:glycosyltransferase [Burkholderia vietnamiensis]|uniref:glycosyltransferase n=1 Tax=Burkholderia vietnamiensis TaxID=60552 RepID=UPI00075E15E0|nr:glycosyltransferase [Burkholderia vietnamiensis]KVE03184.1 transferase [Burkholderia vietnamiensis]KVE20942.1 transferase [Burkholderia vietnamiensis]MBR8189296.1 glycosyltransferase [Burkholderia vietnamiensis]MDN8037767.1 glycosyltransferase [Burkholderia vietnamiensis]UEB99077.1 glycosyltransferase [Burkholderia vietnamiensis]